MVSSPIIKIRVIVLMVNTLTPKAEPGALSGTITIPPLMTIERLTNPYSPSLREAIGQYSSISATFIWGYKFLDFLSGNLIKEIEKCRNVFYKSLQQSLAIGENTMLKK